VALSAAVLDPVESLGVAPESLDFTSLYDEYFPFVWRMASRMGVARSALDDVCQEVFVTVHRRLNEFEGRSSVRTWVFGILMNVVKVHRRTLARKSPAHRSIAPVLDPETVADQAQGPHEAVSEAEAVRIARELIEQLDDDKRIAFILAELEEMPVSEIADALAINVNTAYARLRAARQEFTAAAARHRARDRWRMR
jgi:RNA polymerase sigma-70 factor (ECF subfamily)